MRNWSSAAALTSFQNLTTTSSTRPGAAVENRVSLIHGHGVGFWNPSPEIQIGVLRAQTLVVGGFTDAYPPNLTFIKRNPLHPTIASSSSFSSESQVEPDVENVNGIQTQLPAQGDSPTAHIRLQLHRKCQFGESFHVVGDAPSLGMWDPMDAAPMVWSDSHIWTAELDIPSGKLIEFKFIMRDISGRVLWQPGPNRVLQVREMSKVTVSLGDWEKLEVQQITEERVNDDQYGEYNELAMLHEKTRLANDEAGTYSKTKEAHLERYEGSTTAVNVEEMAMVAENIEHNTYRESGYMRAERKGMVLGTEVEAQRIYSETVKEQVAISNKSVPRGKDILETKQEIPVLVPGLAHWAEGAIVTEEELEHDARITMAENSEPECLHFKGQTQIQFEGMQEGNEGFRETNKEGEEEEVQEVIAQATENPNESSSVNNPEPDQELQMILYEGQDKRSKGILHNDFKWGQEILRRFLDKFGFRLQI